MGVSSESECMCRSAHLALLASRECAAANVTMSGDYSIQEIVNRLNEPPFSKGLTLVTFDDRVSLRAACPAAALRAQRTDCA